MEKRAKRLWRNNPASSSSTQTQTRSSSKSKLNKKLITIIKDKNCPICLTQISGNHRPAIITNCLHAYCLRCLLRWAHYKRTCPLCNSSFHSFFFTSYPSSSSSSSSFYNHHLPPLCPPVGPTSNIPAPRFHFQRRREENQQWRPVQRRRSFGQYNSVPSEVVAQRIFQWRISVYKEGLSAVPSSEKDRQILNFPVNREHVLRKIEPWIHRELRAILQDPDPTIIVHVATTLYLTSIEKQAGAPAASANNEDAFLEPL